MRSGARYVLSLFLLFALVSCSKKPADTASNAPDQNTAAPSNTTAPPTAAAPSNATGENATSSPATPAPVPTPGAVTPGGTTPAVTTPAPAPQPVVVPAGTTLTVRLGNALGSKLSSPGDLFRATLASNVVVDGATVIPKGTSVRGKVVDAKPLGKLKGEAILEIRLTSITVNGADQSIVTSKITRTQKGKGKRTAVAAGGGTAFGAIVGGLAGGGKGAAIGALAGGGAGTAGAAYTGNNDIVLPVESALSFKLRSPLTVNPAQ